MKETWWRPPHLHFSAIGPSSLSRLVTQMYFEGDPLNAPDRILNSIPDRAARQRMIARDLPPAKVSDQWLGYMHDIVRRGRHAMPMTPRGAWPYVQFPALGRRLVHGALHQVQAMPRRVKLLEERQMTRIGSSSICSARNSTTSRTRATLPA